MVVRPIRALALTTVGSFAGFMAAAAFVKHAVPSRGNEESDELGLVAVFDGIDLTSRATSFRGGSVLAWYGGISLDLREATLAPDARLTVHTLFGGVAIRVPPEWRLESNLQALAGGADVRPGSESLDAPTLTLDGTGALRRDRGRREASERGRARVSRHVGWARGRARVPPGDRAGAPRPRGRGIAGRARRELPRADRAARPRARRIRDGLRRAGARGCPPEGRRSRRDALPRRADRAQGSRHDGRDSHDVLQQALRGERPRLRSRPRREDPRRRLRRPRQDEHAGVRHDRVHRLAAERPLPNAVGPRHGTRAGRAEARRRPSRPGSCRSRRARTAAARSGFPPRAAGSSGSRRRAAAFRTRRSCRGSASAPLRRWHGRRSTPPRTSISSPATSGATRSRPRRPSGRTSRRSASIRAACEIAAHNRGADRHRGRSRLRRRRPRGGGVARLARPRSRGGGARLGRRGADGGLPARLAGDSGALPDRRPNRALGR